MKAHRLQCASAGNSRQENRQGTFLSSPLCEGPGATSALHEVAKNLKFKAQIAVDILPLMVYD